VASVVQLGINNFYFIIINAIGPHASESQRIRIFQRAKLSYYCAESAIFKKVKLSILVDIIMATVENLDSPKVAHLTAETAESAENNTLSPLRPL
jgi:hypothetical protein